MLSRAMFSSGDEINDCINGNLDNIRQYIQIKDRAHHTEVNATGEVRKLLCWTLPLDLSFVSICKYPKQNDFIASSKTKVQM